MQAPKGEFVFGRIESVIFGPGTIGALARELDSRRLARTLIITGRTLGSSRLLERVKQALDGRLAGVFAGASQHVPSRTVVAAAEAARSLNADCLVSFGGGSPIDTAKAVAMRLVGGAVETTIDLGVPSRLAGESPLPHFAVSTTLSAAEFTPAGGVTDEVSLRKGAVRDPRLQACVAILDPELTVETPPWLWAATAIRALDHAIETAYSARHQPLGDALAARAIALLRVNLKPSLDLASAESIAHRGHCQLGAWFSIFGLGNARSGISHALGHQIGPRWNVAHGVTSCITLPHVMRFMAEIAPERFGPIAEGFCTAFDPANPRAAALECAGLAADFIARLGLPTRLRDVGVARAELAEIGETVSREVDRSAAVGRPVGVDELLRLLETAY